MTAVKPAILGRRRVPRRAFESPVGVLILGEYGLEQAYQVGEGGMMISSQRAIQVGSKLVCSFFLSPLVTIIVRGVVRNTVPAQGHLPLRYGIEFANLEFQYKREIRNFVASATQSDSEV